MVCVGEPVGARVKSKPMPESARNEAIGSALLVKFRLPFCAPALTGAKARRPCNGAPGASVTGQVVLTTESPP